MIQSEVGRFKQPLFTYKGKDYRVAGEGGIVVAIDRSKLPQTLMRVIAPQILTFDENNILSPQNPAVTNDMVSTASPNDWEKFARMFHFGGAFQVVSLDRDRLVGPTFLAGNRILTQGEILTLAPKDAIKEIALYAWGSAESSYDYGENAYADAADRDFYQRLIVNRTKGSKPIYIQSVPLE